MQLAFPTTVFFQVTLAILGGDGQDQWASVVTFIISGLGDRKGTAKDVP